MWPVICFSTLLQKERVSESERGREWEVVERQTAMVIIKSLIIRIWLLHSSTNHIRKLRVVIFISGKIGSDFEMDDLAEFLECHSRIIISFAFHVASLVVCCCCCLWVAWFPSSAFICLMKLERLAHLVNWSEFMTTICEIQNNVQHKIFRRRRHPLFTSLVKIVRIWFIFTWNVHCNRLVAFILEFIIHELNWSLIFFCYYYYLYRR